MFTLKIGTWEGAELPLTQLAAFTLVTNNFWRFPVLLIEYTINPLYWERGLWFLYLLYWAAPVPCQIKQGSLSSAQSVVINNVHPKNRDLRRRWAAANSTCCIYPSHKQFLTIPCFVNRVHNKPSVFREGTLVPVPSLLSSACPLSN